MGHDLSQDAEIWDDAYKLDRAHVFHSWHAQRNLDPTEGVTGHGVWLKYGDGREPAGQRQHRLPAPEGDRGHQEASGTPVHRRT